MRACTCARVDAMEIQVPNPSFDSQAKEALSSKVTDLNAVISIPDRFIKTIADDFGLARLVIDAIEVCSLSPLLFSSSPLHHCFAYCVPRFSFTRSPQQ